MARVLTVLFCVTSRDWGGTEKWALEAARSLSGRGHRAVALWSHERVLRQVEARGLPARRVWLPGDVNPISFASLAGAPWSRWASSRARPWSWRSGDSRG